MSENHAVNGHGHGQHEIHAQLGPRLSPKASIVHYSTESIEFRELWWSSYNAPKAKTVVYVKEENDVVETVKYCNEHNLDFAAQSGGHGWGDTFTLKDKDVVINLRGLNSVTFNGEKDVVTIGGGVIAQEVTEAAHRQGLQVPTGNCNYVGVLGALLGGGYGRLMGRYGLGIDNLLSVNLVTADGTIWNVTPENPSTSDLWWAIRGAGPNFGIVTSARMNAYPILANDQNWTGNLVYSPDKLEEVIIAASQFPYPPDCSLHIYFASPPPTFTPVVVVNPWYAGSEQEGKKVLQPFFDIGPVAQMMETLPYTKVNAGGDIFCVNGARKPATTAGLRRLDPAAFREVFEIYKDFVARNPTAGMSAMLLECYSQWKQRELAKEAGDKAGSYAHRDIDFLAVMLPWYDDPALDKEAEELARKARDIWRTSDGFEGGKKRVYVNMAIGDETQDEIYGESLERLRKVKRVWDPKNRFGQWFPIHPETDGAAK